MLRNFLVVVMAFAFSVSHGDSASPPPGSLVTAPGDETPPRDPFTLYDSGPEEGHWSYDKLSPAQKAVVDRGRSRPNAAAIHASYDRAVKAAAEAGQAKLAADRLHSSNMETIGVVP